MADKKIALVLGGTVPHIQLIKQLQARGYYTILVDYLENPPARSFANEHIRESTLDREAVLGIAGKRKAELVISSAVDQANITCCYVAEKMGLPHPYSYETALNVTHKDRMKRIMVSYGIPTAPFLNASDIVSFDGDDLDFPCVVKPTNCNGSRGVHIAYSPEELFKYIAIAREASRTGEAIVEAFITGVEVSSYYYVQNGESHLLGTCQKMNYTKYKENTVRQYESVFYPAQLTEKTQRCLISVANCIAEAFGLSNTPLFLQAIVDDKGDVFVLEFAPRLGGGMCFRAIPILTGFDFIGASISSFIGEEVDLSTIGTRGYHLMIGNMFARPGTFDHVCGVGEAVSKGLINEFYATKTKGSEISSDGSSGSRFGQFIVLGNSYDELLDKDAKARQIIQAFNADGRKISV